MLVFNLLFELQRNHDSGFADSIGANLVACMQARLLDLHVPSAKLSRRSDSAAVGKRGQPCRPAVRRVLVFSRVALYTIAAAPEKGAAWCLPCER